MPPRRPSPSRAWRLLRNSPPPLSTSRTVIRGSLLHHCYPSGMRSPGRKRARPHDLAHDVDAEQLTTWSAAVTYVGSPEHKTYPSFAGQPRLRSDATPCPKHIHDAQMVTAWLREGILAGHVSAHSDRGQFPRYVWSKIDDQWFEARLVNSEQGTYKGYPVMESEIPRALAKEVS